MGSRRGGDGLPAVELRAELIPVRTVFAYTEVILFTTATDSNKDYQLTRLKTVPSTASKEAEDKVRCRFERSRY